MNLDHNNMDEEDNLQALLDEAQKAVSNVLYTAI
jgi:hypothetical protein